jgi:Flp pilus assembly protein TadG
MRAVRRLRSDSGAAAVEFALVALILFTLLLGTIQFGYNFFEYISVAHAAREGVRWAALGADEATVDARAQAAAPGLSLPASSITVTPIPATYSVQVSVTHPRTVLVPIPFVELPHTITSTAEQRVE